MSECDTVRGRSLQQSTGQAAARLAGHQLADRLALRLHALSSALRQIYFKANSYYILFLFFV
jgi:hypothetical protein